MITRMTLTGRVAHVKSVQEKGNYFYVLTVHGTDGHMHEVQGHISPVLARQGMLLCMTVNKDDNNSYLTFLKSFVDITHPEGVSQYLRTGAVAYLPVAAANQMIRHFGVKVLDILDAGPEKIKDVPGINDATKERVLTYWAIHRKQSKAVIEVLSLGLSCTTAHRVVEHFGDDAADIIIDDPYNLSRVYGYGYIRADQYARNRGIDMDSDLRIRAALSYCLNASMSEGHSYLPVSELIKRAAKETGTENQRVGKVSFPEDIVVTPSNKAYVSKLYEVERDVSRRIRIMSYENSVLAQIRDQIKSIINGKDISPDQAQAVNDVLTGPRLSIVTGLPGTGKTTLIKAMIETLTSLGIHCTLAAPTGKAAARITEQTGHKAYTIHRMLGAAKGGNIRRDDTKPIDTNFLVVDEASMIDLALMQQILKALPAHAMLVLVGDNNQLPSVGPGCILREMKEKELCNIATLTQVHRQSSRSTIIKVAHAIHQGIVPLGLFNSECVFIAEEESQAIREKIIELVSNHKHYSPDTIQVLSPMRKGSIGTNQLNEDLKNKIRNHNIQILREKGINVAAAAASVTSSVSYEPGDRVIQKSNSYRKSVFNGEIGYVIRRDPCEEQRGEKVTVLFDDGRQITYEPHELYQIELAYALTVHKGQGSEYPCVIIPVHTSHHIMLYRSLIYTAVTRAREMVIIVGSNKALERAVKNNNPDMRYANLTEVNI